MRVVYWAPYAKRGNVQPKDECGAAETTRSRSIAKHKRWVSIALLFHIPTHHSVVDAFLDAGGDAGGDIVMGGCALRSLLHFVSAENVCCESKRKSGVCNNQRVHDCAMCASGHAELPSGKV